MHLYDTCFQISLLCLGDHNFPLLCILVPDVGLTVSVCRNSQTVGVMSARRCLLY
ncbi:unnamed protein product [Ixodes pacificus]